MSTMHYQPTSVLNQIQDEMNRLWCRTVGNEADVSNVTTSQWLPSVDILEEPEQFLLRADVPGVDPKLIEVSMDNGVLTIKGERISEKKQEHKGYKRIERAEGVFYRRFSLPDTADAENISAQGKNGVLEIVIPKKEKGKARKIVVEG